MSPDLDLSCIVVGYLPSPEGAAAYERAKEWARKAASADADLGGLRNDVISASRSRRTRPPESHGFGATAHPSYP